MSRAPQHFRSVYSVSSVVCEHERARLCSAVRWSVLVILPGKAHNFIAVCWSFFPANLMLQSVGHSFRRRSYCRLLVIPSGEAHIAVRWYFFAAKLVLQFVAHSFRRSSYCSSLVILSCGAHTAVRWSVVAILSGETHVTSLSFSFSSNRMIYTDVIIAVIRVELSAHPLLHPSLPPHLSRNQNSL